MTSTTRFALVAATAAVLLTALCGCGLGASSVHGPNAASGHGGAASHGAAVAPSTHPSTTHQAQLTAIPTTCPSADEVSLGVSYTLPSVYTSADDGALTCEYYNASDTTHVIFLVYGAADGITTSVFGQKVLATTPSAVSVPGVGEAAYYYVLQETDGQIGNMRFLSGPVAGYVYGPISIASQAKLTHLVADMLLVP